MSPTLRLSLTNTIPDQRIIIEYDDTTRAWNDLKHDNFTPKYSVREYYRTSLSECTKSFMSNHGSFDYSKSTETIDVPSLVKEIPQIGQQCSICRRYQGQIYPCRICGKVYHQQCIRDLGQIKSSHWIKNAMSLIGWTCPICEDLRGLLSTNDLAEINTWIRSVNVHTTITLDTYIKTRFHLTSPFAADFDHFNDNMKQMLHVYLDSIVDISPNRLSQSDLYILEITLKLLRTSPEHLVHRLTSFELHSLSLLFLNLSSPDHQYITYDRFEQVFHSYLRTTLSDFSNDDDEHLHLHALAYGVLGDKAETPRTWPQFLLETTIPTLLNRFNHRSLVDFVNRIVSTTRSSTPSTAEVLEQVDQQTVSNLIKNVLDKLQRPSRKSTFKES